MYNWVVVLAGINRYCIIEYLTASQSRPELRVIGCASLYSRVGKEIDIRMSKIQYVSILHYAKWAPVFSKVLAAEAYLYTIMRSKRYTIRYDYGNKNDILLTITNARTKWPEGFPLSHSLVQQTTKLNCHAIFTIMSFESKGFSTGSWFRICTLKNYKR